MELSEKQRKHIYLIHIAGKEAAEAKRNNLKSKAYFVYHVIF